MVVLKSTECVRLVRKEADEIKITIFFKSFGVKERKEPAVTSSLTN
jgi:hypothetical protein